MLPMAWTVESSALPWVSLQTLSSPRLLFPASQEPVKESYDGAPAQGVYGWRASPSVRRGPIPSASPTLTAMRPCSAEPRPTRRRPKHRSL